MNPQDQETFNHYIEEEISTVKIFMKEKRIGKLEEALGIWVDEGHAERFRTVYETLEQTKQEITPRTLYEQTMKKRE